METTTTTVGTVSIGGTVTVKCNCVYDDYGLRVPQTASCPIHDMSTYTTGVVPKYGTLAG